MIKNEKNESIEVFLLQLSEDELHSLNGIRNGNTKKSFHISRMKQVFVCDVPRTHSLEFCCKMWKLIFSDDSAPQIQRSYLYRLPTKLRKGNVFSHVCLSVMSCLCVHRTCRPYMLLNEQVWTCLGGEGDLGPVQMEGRYLICRKGEGAEALYKGQLASYRMLSYNHIIGGSLQIDLRLGISDSFLGIFFGNWQIAHDIRVHSTTIHAGEDKKSKS